MHRSAIIFTVLLALPALPLRVGGQSFEGIIKERSLDMEEEALFELIHAGSEEEPDFDTEAEWLRHTAKKLFDIPIERLIDSGAEATEITMYVRGTKVSYAPSSGETGDTYMMMDLATMTTWIVMPEERAYVEVTPEGAEEAVTEATRQAEEMMKRMGIDPEELAANAAELEGDTPEMDDEVGFESSVRPLNRTEEVNGVSASGYWAEAGSEIGVGWCADDVTGMRKAMEKLAAQMEVEEEEGGMGGPSVDELLCESDLPVRKQVLSVGTMGGGLWYTVQEVLSVERTPVDADLFEIPAGFEKRSWLDMYR